MSAGTPAATRSLKVLPPAQVLARWQKAWADISIRQLNRLLPMLAPQAWEEPWFPADADADRLVVLLAKRRAEKLLLAVLAHPDGRRLLASWSDKPYKFNHPLLWGVRSRSLPVLDVLLAHPWPGIESTPARKSTADPPWMEAARLGWTEGWERLVSVLGPRVAWTTPLHAAARFRRPEWVKAQLERGVDPNRRDHGGRTPLGTLVRLMEGSERMSASQMPNAYVMRVLATATELLVAGAAMDIPDGKTSRARSIRASFLRVMSPATLAGLEARVLDRVTGAALPAPPQPPMRRRL